MAVVAAAVNLSAQVTYNLSYFGTPTPVAIALSNAIQLAAGSGAKQFNNCYEAPLSIASGTPVVLNLTGTLADPGGTTITFADLVYVALVAPSTNTGNVVFGGGTDPVASILGTSGTVTLPPGATAIFALPAAAGYGITTTSADRLQFTASAGTQALNVLLLGH